MAEVPGLDAWKRRGVARRRHRRCKISLPLPPLSFLSQLSPFLFTPSPPVLYPFLVFEWRLCHDDNRASLGQPPSGEEEGHEKDEGVRRVEFSWAGNACLLEATTAHARSRSRPFVCCVFETGFHRVCICRKRVCAHRWVRVDV